MDTQILPDPHLNLDYRIDAFEEARRLNPRVDLTHFLPPRDHPDYLETLTELIRVELDLEWAGGCARPLSEYLLRFPELADDKRRLGDVAFEEYRLRRQAGQNATPEEYERLFGIVASNWPSIPTTGECEVVPDSDPFPLTRRSDEASELRASEPNLLAGFRTAGPPGSWVESVVADPEHRQALRDLERQRPESAKRWAEAMAAMPEAGSKFLGFRLISELGRGAFGRVFLAQQSDLANRLVALKVGTDLFEESQTLAQLQHTNIVPIYSLHQVGRLQAVCMPYCGSTTLAHVLQHIQSLAGLPTSGKDLVSTVHGRKSATAQQGSANRESTTGIRESAHGSAVVQEAAGSPSSSATDARNGAADDRAQPAIPAHASETWKLLEGMSFTDAVLWLAIHLVDGLDHAHQRGVLHRDLKPANILLTDDGTPMLLDFNLAAGRLRDEPTAAKVGGTMPYMAPEHLHAFQGAHPRPDERSDLYSLGVILYNLLTARHPFPTYKGSWHDTVKRMLEDRSTSPPRLRTWNRTVSPALEAIVRKCLEPDPANRYQSARDLREDLERQLHHLPLKHVAEPSLRERASKFARRHPYLTSTASISAVALVLILAIGAAGFALRERVRSLDARAEFREHIAELRAIQTLLDERNPPPARLEQGLARCERELARYGLTADGGTQEWQHHIKVRYLDEATQAHLRENIGELFYLMARAAVQKAELERDADVKHQYLCSAERWNELANASAGERLPRALREQRADLLKMKGMDELARQLRQDMPPPSSPRDQYLLGHWLAKQGEFRQALPHLQQATRDDPESYSAWFVRGNVHNGLGQFESAAECFSACIALRPESAPAWHNRGRAYSQLRHHQLALADFDRAIQLDGDLVEPVLDRALTLQRLRKFPEALAELERLAQMPNRPSRVLFLRANLRHRQGDWLGAALDIARGLAEPPTDELSYIARAEQYARDPNDCLVDIEEALRINPTSMFALQLKAHVLSERLNRPDEAMQALNQLAELYPDYVPGRAGRGVMLARAGKSAEALTEAREALLRDTKPPTLYQVAGIFALLSKHSAEYRREALRLLWSALRANYGLDLIDIDHDLDPLRNDPEFRRIVAVAREMYRNGPR